MNVTLEPGEIDAVKLLARLRYETNRAAGVRDAKVGPQSAEATDLDGLGAEVAAAKWLGCYPDLSITPRAGGWDLTYRGKTIDVKHTTRPGGRLLATMKKTRRDADIYLLVTGRLPEYELVGYAWASEFLRPENVRDLGHGPTYALDQDKLRRF